MRETYEVAALYLLFGRITLVCLTISFHSLME